MSVCAHFTHLNVRCSKPSVPSETAAVIIRVRQFGQRGRRIGKSSGSDFFQGFMMATLAPTFRGCLSGLQDQIMEPAGNEDAASGGGYLLGDWAGGSTSGARGLRSGGGLASNCDLRSAAFSTSMAAKSGFAVDLANLRIVVA